MLELALLSRLGADVVVLVAASVAAFAVFNSVLDGIRLTIVLDTSWAGRPDLRYLRAVMAAGLTVVALFAVIFGPWLRMCAGAIAQIYDLAPYICLSVGLALLMAIHYVLAGLLYAAKHERVTTAINIGAYATELTLVAVFVLTSTGPPRYLIQLTAACIAFGSAVMIEAACTAILRRRSPSAPTVSTTMRAITRRFSPIAADRAAIFVGFAIVFVWVSRLPPAQVAGYLFVTRAVAIAYTAVYGVELILTRGMQEAADKPRQDRQAARRALLKTSLATGFVFGGAVVLAELAFHGQLASAVLAAPGARSLQIIGTALLVALPFQLINWVQILLGGFLRAAGHRVFVSAANIAVYLVALPAVMRVALAYSHTLVIVWLLIGIAYLASALIFLIPAFRVATRPPVMSGLQGREEHVHG
jgi:Na+-driven multidrug efflux pump